MKTMLNRSFMIRWFFTIVTITACVYLSFRYLLPLIFPFLVAYFLAWIIRPVTEALYQRMKIPRVIGGSFSLLLLVGVFGTAFCMMINILIKQAILFIKNIPIWYDVIAGKLDSVCAYMDNLFGCNCGTVRNIVDDNLKNTVIMVKTDIIPKLTKQSIFITIQLVGFIGIVLIVLVAAVLIAKDQPLMRKYYEKNKLYQEFHKVTVKLSEAGIAFLRCQLIIMSIVAVICVLGLYFIKNEYAMLLGIGIAILDALPILGSGMVLVPWSIVTLINGNIFKAAMLFTIFLVCQVIREILEPKLIGNRIGIKPLYTLIAMYIGVKLFSLAGFFLGPIGLLIIITIFKVLYEKAEENTCEKDAFL